MANRRQFLSSVAAAGFPSIVKGSALGLNGAVAPSNRVVMATIGTGNMGNGHLNAFLKIPEAQVVAICDLDDVRSAAAKAKIDKTYGNQDCVVYRAFEEVTMRRDIDAVTIATPDHWHGLVAIQAARNKKDIYGEKPLAHNFREGLAIVNEVKKFDRIWQTGSWQRSKPQFHQACELVRNGRIGKVTTVEVGLPSGPNDYGKMKDKLAFTEPPATFNYDRWLGPGPEVPYCEARCHGVWRWNLDFGGGQLMDWVGHHVDIAHWGLGFDGTGPYEIEGVGEYPARTELWNTAKKYKITARYAGGVTMTIAGGYPEIRSGTKWIGDKGWIWVDRRGIEASSPEILKSEIGAGEIHLTKSLDHYKQFVDCVRSREKTLTPAEVAFRSATPGWLGQIAMLTGRKLQFDPVALKLKNDPQAEKMLGRTMRAPFQL